MIYSHKISDQVVRDLPAQFPLLLDVKNPGPRKHIWTKHVRDAYSFSSIHFKIQGSCVKFTFQHFLHENDSTLVSQQRPLLFYLELYHFHNSSEQPQRYPTALSMINWCYLQVLTLVLSLWLLATRLVVMVLGK